MFLQSNSLLFPNILLEDIRIFNTKELGKLPDNFHFSISFLMNFNYPN